MARATCQGLGGEGRDAASHLRQVAEDTKSKAAAFELHLQGGAPGHCDPAPMVSREHACSPLAQCAPCAPGISLSRAWAPVPRRPPSYQCSRESPQLPGSQTPPPETTPGLGRARHPPLPPPLKSGPVLGRQANLGRQFHCQRHPKVLQQGPRAPALSAGLAHLHLRAGPQIPSTAATPNLSNRSPLDPNGYDKVSVKCLQRGRQKQGGSECQLHASGRGRRKTKATQETAKVQPGER